MASAFARLYRAFLPTHLDNPLSMLGRVLRSADRDAWSAVGQTAVGLAVLPLDRLLRPFEQRSYRAAAAPALPQVFVCGPSRSGTTFTCQLLARQLPVSYFPNLIGMFPSSPVSATRMLGRSMNRRRIRFTAFYSKSSGLYGTNDAPFLWDRWFGPDRTGIPERPSADALRAMVQFFGAWERLTQLPLVAKNNRLYLYGDIVAEALPRSTFICLRRNAVLLAQSQLIARRRILGRDDLPYGPVTPGYLSRRSPDDPVRDSCILVASYRDAMEATQRAVGPDRFWIVSYEDICRAPNALLARVATNALAATYEPLTDTEIRDTVAPTTRRLVDDETYARIVAICEDLGIADGAT
jgi:hypothetical protein